MRQYRITNRLTKEVQLIVALSAQEACAQLGWMIGNCWVGVTTTELSSVQVTVDRASLAIATLPVEQWPGWVTYLLEALESEMEKQDWRAAEYGRDAQWRLLEAVKASLETRLDAGRW